ncbi:MAG: hypothetical protein A4S14_00285 [Proteobacteria bacterium SG_bin9]|nr:MAG: hypothetical protein A4S14_00285 [Proteobacteria bacterium SG_bin9]
MAYRELLTYARANTHKDAPGLAKIRFLRVNNGGSIAYDHFLSLAQAHGLEAPLVRKVMYFLWAYRDDRIRRFVCERIADQSGRWRIDQLVNKANSDFFEEMLQSGTATKARSNFEYFLVETKIFDPTAPAVHLELEDGWFEQAALAAAQHEDDPIIRAELLANPIKFLEDRGWLGLLNWNGSSATMSSPLLTSDSAPLEDAEFEVSPASASTSFDWNRSGPSASGKKTTTAKIDLIARERANASHFLLEKILADLARGKKLAPKYNQNIDLYFDSPKGSVLAEIKSCNDTNFHAQLRKAVSQLLEYKFVYTHLFASSPTLLLIMETSPPKEKTWLADYTQSLGIILAWKNHSSQEIVTRSEIPSSLAGILVQIPT